MGFGGALPSGPRIDNHPQRGSFYPSALAVDVLRFLPHRGRDSRAGADYSISSSLTASQDGTLRVRRGVAALGRRTESPARTDGLPLCQISPLVGRCGGHNSGHDTRIVGAPDDLPRCHTSPLVHHWQGHSSWVRKCLPSEVPNRWIVPQTDCRQMPPSSVYRWAWLSFRIARFHFLIAPPLSLIS